MWVGTCIDMVCNVVVFQFVVCNNSVDWMDWTNMLCFVAITLHLNPNPFTCRVFVAGNHIGVDGGQAIAAALEKNTALTSLNLESEHG